MTMYLPSYPGSSTTDRIVFPTERALGIALGVSLLGAATSLVALIVVLVWL